MAANKHRGVVKAVASSDDRQRRTLETWKEIAPEHFALAYMQSQFAAINSTVLVGRRKGTA